MEWQESTASFPESECPEGKDRGHEEEGQKKPRGWTKDNVE